MNNVTTIILFILLFALPISFVIYGIIQNKRKSKINRQSLNLKEVFPIEETKENKNTWKI